MSTEKALAAPKPTDKEGKYLPWLTYGAIAFLQERVKPTMGVFEYGAGASTVWWAKHAEVVHACEHNPAWCLATRKMLEDGGLENARVTYEERGSQGYIGCCKRNRKWNVIVIDGRDRVNCAIEAVDSLRKDGVIIWDNSERKKYRPGFQMLVNRGFQALHFEGPGPLRKIPWRTTIFWRPDNCMGIE